MARPTRATSRKAWTVNREHAYAPIPPLPPPEITRPVIFCVPDHPDWRASLYGAIGMMQSWMHWQRDEGHSGKAAAQVWRKIISEAQHAAETGEASECMDWCLIIADCIANNDSTKQAIRNFFEEDTAMQTIIETIIDKAAQEGRLSLEKREGPLVKGVNCTPGSIFKRIGTLVTTLHLSVTDVFQELEVISNAAERAEKFIAAIPVVGILPIDEIIGFVEQLADNVYEEYLGAYDELLYDEIRCGLFCEFHEACEFSLEDVVAWYKTKAGAAVDLSDPMNALRLIIEFIASGGIETDLAVYAMHLFVLACMRTGQSVIGLDFTRLALRIEADANEIDDDYLILCEECVEIVLDPNCFYFKTSSAGFTPVSGLGVWYEGQGLGPLLSAGQYYLSWQKVKPTSGQPQQGPWNSMKIVFDAPIGNIQVSAGGVNYNLGATPQKEYTLNEASHPNIFPLYYYTAAPTILVRALNNGPVPGTTRIEQICFFP